MKRALLIYTRIFDPFVVICAAYLVVFFKFGHFPTDLRLLCFVIIINLAIPIVYFLHLLKTKKVGNWDVTNKFERRKIFGPLILFICLSTLILFFVGAGHGLPLGSPWRTPTELWNYLLRLQFAGILLFSYLYFVSPIFKSSGHVGTMGVFYLFLLKMYGINAWWFIILIIIQGIARVQLGKHTVGEVIAGFVSGIIIGSIVVFLL